MGPQRSILPVICQIPAPTYDPLPIFVRPLPPTYDPLLIYVHVQDRAAAARALLRLTHVCTGVFHGQTHPVIFGLIT